MTLRPHSLSELQEMTRSLATIRVRGGATKREARAGDVDLTALAGVVDYSPDECVVTAAAGTPLRDVVQALHAHGQYLPFDPPFVDHGASVGGTVAAGLSGPRRYRYGGVRDFVIGIRLVDGEGRAIRSGGRVVKNAAGFLLHHGVVGSWGRFGVLTEVTLKVFPAPEARRTVALACGSVERAFEAAQQVESLRMDCESIEFDEQGALEMTVAGRAAVIDARAERLASRLETFVTGGLPVFGGEAGLRTIGKPANSRPVPVENVVRVAGLAKSWPTLQPLISHAHFMCAGAVAWLTTADLTRLDLALRDAQLAGQVIRGATAGQRIGHVITSEFEERVRRVLDPHGRFHAAPDSD